MAFILFQYNYLSFVSLRIICASYFEWRGINGLVWACWAPSQAIFGGAPLANCMWIDPCLCRSQSQPPTTAPATPTFFPSRYASRSRHQTTATTITGAADATRFYLTASATNIWAVAQALNFAPDFSFLRLESLCAVRLHCSSLAGRADSSYQPQSMSIPFYRHRI